MDVKKAMVAAAGAGLIAVGGLGVWPPSAGASSAAPSRHRPGVWPAQVDGRSPDVGPGAGTGYYLWHSDTGWRLEATHPGAHAVVFSGSVTADGTLTYRRDGLEGADLTDLSRGSHVLRFAFDNHGRLDGIGFVTHQTTQLTFRLFVDGHDAARASVLIGAAGLHPARVPFTIGRTEIR